MSQVTVQCISEIQVDTNEVLSQLTTREIMEYLFEAETLNEILECFARDDLEDFVKTF